MISPKWLLNLSPGLFAHVLGHGLMAAPLYLVALSSLVAQQSSIGWPIGIIGLAWGECVAILLWAKVRT